MPRQDLAAAPAATSLSAPGMMLRRLSLALGSGAIAALVGGTLLEVLSRNGLTPLELITVILSTVLGGWVGFGFMTASAGFVAARSGFGGHNTTSDDLISGRTAILLPAYNEDPGLILSAVEAIAEDLRRLGRSASFDFFILSDTRDEAIAREEAVGVLRLRGRLGKGVHVYYRRRAANVDRKAGNIGEWLERFGGAYAYMLILDADSLMSGETIVALSSAMEREPKLGLLQSVPTIINAETPFARLQQFASRLYGPVFARGQQWWSGNEGNYWGHNAIIRVTAFAESAGLPHLSGPRPFGGHIMSHDFIEAALLRRRGWAVRTMAALPGSYEETPPTLLDAALRDRRWCQGNLQHARVLNAAGLHWVSRVHLFLGIFAYLAPALWLMLLVCGALIWPSQHLLRGSLEYQQIIGLFGLSLALLILPKMMAVVLALGSSRTRAGFGGGGRLLAGFLVESAVAMLTAPVMMVMQSVAVVEVLLGRDSGWKPQRREGVELRGRDAWRAHRVHVMLGLLGGFGAFLVSKYLLVWASPVFLSLALSALLSLHTSKPKTGRALTRRGLFQIPEDENPPTVLARSLELRRAYAGEARTRREISALFRAPVPMHEPSVWRVGAAELQLVA